MTTDHLGGAIQLAKSYAERRTPPLFRLLQLILPLPNMGIMVISIRVFYELPFNEIVYLHGYE